MSLRKKLFLPIASVAAVAGIMVGTTGLATAATDPTLPVTNGDYGFDGNANLIVGGGSTTLYKVVQGLADLYNDSSSCATNNATYNSAGSAPYSYPQSSAAFNQCSPTTQSYSGTEAGGNYDGDTVAVAAAVGSSDGIASLNGDHSSTKATYAYEGTNANLVTGSSSTGLNSTNGYGTVDFGFSSRAGKTSGGNCSLSNGSSDTNDEFLCDTFFGIAADGVEVFTWGSTTAGGTADNTSLGGLTDGLTGADLYNIWHCNYTTWGQLPEYSEAVSLGDPVPPSAAPIVPWSMNSGSGTYADFDTYVNNNDGGEPTFTADDDAGAYSTTNADIGSETGPAPVTGKCDRELSTSSNPLPTENDVKPLLQDIQLNQGGLSTDPYSTNNPANWIWFGSYGLLTSYQYLSNPSLYGNQYDTFASPIGAGVAPSTSNIGKGTYPAERILNLVVPNADATCPAVSGSKCTFAGGPVNANGTTDMNLPGATGGVGGAVREFVRFLCRTQAETKYTATNPQTSASVTSYSPLDPYTGNQYSGTSGEISSVIEASGFTTIPTSLQSTSSSCDVQSSLNNG